MPPSADRGTRWRSRGDQGLDAVQQAFEAILAQQIGAARRQMIAVVASGWATEGGEGLPRAIICTLSNFPTGTWSNTGETTMVRQLEWIEPGPLPLLASLTPAR